MDYFTPFDKNNLLEILGHLISDIHAIIVIADKDRRITYINKNASVVIGDISKNIGGNLYDFLGIDSSDSDLINKIEYFLKRDNKFETITCMTNANKETIYLDHTISLIKYKENINYYLAISKDITHTYTLKQQVYRANYFDSLTDLPNQRTFLETINTYKDIAKQENIRFNIILIDISKVSAINNRYGFVVGDYVIQEVGHRIRKVLDFSDVLAKFKDDIFAVLHAQLTDTEESAMLLDSLTKELKYPIKINQNEIYVDFRAGIVTYPDNESIEETLIDKAQIALTKAKFSNQHIKYMFYTPEIENEVRQQIKMEAKMYKALENDEFDVYYQPFLDIDTNTIVGMEALLRKINSNGDIELPGTFIPVLEQMKLMDKVGLIVIEKVCIQIRKWIDAGFKIVPVAINLSPVQFENSNLPQNIMTILKKHNISPQNIILEITENVLIQDINLTQDILNRLNEYGFSIALDDFGTGYSSIGYLKQFKFDHLKIDISFIRGILKNKQDKNIVKAIIAIAKSFKLKTIAEGIEQEEQLKVVLSLGCEMGQGYLWDKPIPAKLIEEKYILLTK